MILINIPFEMAAWRSAIALHWVLAPKDLLSHLLKSNAIERLEKAGQNSIFLGNPFGVAAGYKKDGAPAVH